MHEGNPKVILISRAILLFICLLSFGCSTTKWQVVEEEKPGGFLEYYKPEPNSKRIVGFDYAYIDRYGEIFLTPKSYIYSRLYKAPRVNIWQKSVKPADPIGAVMTTGLTVGMNILFEPKKTGNQLIGESCCERFVRSYINYNKEEALESFGWEPYPSNLDAVAERFIIRGLHSYDVTISFNNGPTNRLIGKDISDLILASPFNGNLTLEVFCANCNFPANLSKQALFLNVSNSANISINVDDLKASIRSLREDIQKEKKRQAEIASRKNQANPINPTNQCLNIGLKQGSEDFIKCIKTLTK
jgi:hypothetical protein